jgi:hypothetical protein
MHGNNTKNLSVSLSLPRASKNSIFFLLSFIYFFSTKLENKRAEQLLPGGWLGGGVKVAQIIYTHISVKMRNKI